MQDGAESLHQRATMARWTIWRLVRPWFANKERGEQSVESDQGAKLRESAPPADEELQWRHFEARLVVRGLRIAYAMRLSSNTLTRARLSRARHNNGGAVRGRCCQHHLILPKQRFGGRGRASVFRGSHSTEPDQ